MKRLRVLFLHTLLPGLLLVGSGAQATAPLDGMLLGRSEAELQSQFESLTRLRRPIPGPHGLRGLWTMQDTDISGLPFQTTFYFKDNRVSRIEQRWTSAQAGCRDASVFDAVVAELASKYGSGLSAQAQGDVVQQSVVWQTEAFDAMAYQSEAAAACTILVVYKPHEVKDASEL